MSSVASLRRKDNMWIYKNPQGLQVLDDELNERRKKRSARTTRFISTTPPLSPTKSTKQNMIPIAKISHSMRPLSPPQQQQQRPKLVKAKEYQQNLNLTEEIHLREKKTVLLPAEKKCVVPESSLVKKNYVTEKSNLPEKKSLSENMSLPIVPKRKSLPEKSLPGKIDLSQWKPKSMDEKNKKKLSVITSTTHVTQPSVIVQESHSSNNNNSLSPLVINQPDSPLHNPDKLVSSHNTRTILSPVASSLPSPVASPSLLSSPIKRVKSPTAAAENQFLIEAKQKLFSKQQSSIQKNLPSTPTAKKSRMVSSFVSAFETPPSGKTTQDKVSMPSSSFTPPSSISTPLLSPPVTTSETTVTPVSSCSTPVSMKDSYFSEVIDRRFSPTPTETEDEPILVYFPQLSPDMSFCTNALDIPSDDITFQKRPCIKKQVSFSEQLSTVIDDLLEEPEDEEEGEEAASPISSFVRTLSNELSNHSAALPKASSSNREKFIPVLIKNEKKKESVVVPQKLSNKLLDIFQKKPTATTTAATVATIATPIVDQPAKKELVHLTKSRPRKPASLKKPTNLAYPAAIAQPDWRTRVITTKKSPVFI